MAQNQEKPTDLPNIGKKINYSLIAIAIFAFIAISAYIINFGIIPYLEDEKLRLSSDSGDWGTFGDYIGGLLNPCIALFALYWLTSSIKTQIKELTETREQFEKISQNQLEQTSLQNFESLFFQLLETKDKAVQDIFVKSKKEIEEVIIYKTIKKSTYKGFGYYDESTADGDGKKFKEILTNDMENGNIIGKESIRKHMILFKSLSKYNWQEFYTQLLLDYMGNYFRICYQIVKLIDENELLSKNTDGKENKNKDKKTELQKKYFDIFRATLTQYELEAFFFNCLSEYGNKKFKKLIEDYGLFEPLLIDIDKDFEEIHRLTRYAYMYDKKSFENNEMFKQYFDDIEKLKNINFKKLRDEICLMYNNKVITYSNQIYVENFDFVDNFEKYIFRYKFERQAQQYLKDKNIFWDKTIISYKDSIAKLDDNIQKHCQKSDFEQEVKKWGEDVKKYYKFIDLINNISYSEEIDIIIKYKINISEFFDYYQISKD